MWPRVTTAGAPTRAAATLAPMASEIKTLPDYLRPGLDIIFVGINPGMSSAEAGRYFFTPRNRFWPAFNAARLTPEPLGPETDAKALDHGIGFTDVVKRPTRQMSELRAADYREGAALLREKLLRFQPLVVCFNGLSGYKNYLRYTGGAFAAAKLGLQPERLGRSLVYAMPSTSPANAAVSLERIVEAMTELKIVVAREKAAKGAS